MQNWNDGKAQEYKDRKVYDVGLSLNRHFHETPVGAPAEAAAPVEAAAPGTEAAADLILFTTSTCPKCVMAKKFLADAGIAYQTVVVDQNPAPAKQYGIKQAPTLLVLRNGEVAERIENPSNIRRFAETRK